MSRFFFFLELSSLELVVMLTLVPLKLSKPTLREIFCLVVFECLMKILFRKLALLLKSVSEIYELCSLFDLFGTSFLLKPFLECGPNACSGRCRSHVPLLIVFDRGCVRGL